MNTISNTPRYLLEMTPGEWNSLSGGSNKEFTQPPIECRKSGENLLKAREIKG